MALGAALIVGVLVVLLQATRAAAFPYRKAGALLTPAERAFLAALEPHLAGRIRVFAKVRVADLIAIQPGLGRERALVALNRIAQKHVDFVLAHPVSFDVLCAIELDDQTHSIAARRQRDAFLERAFEFSGLTLIRMKASNRYSPDALRQLINSVVNP